MGPGEERRQVNWLQVSKPGIIEGPELERVGWEGPKMGPGQERRQVNWLQVSKPGFIGGPE